jgi:hypothetical protein
MFGPFDHFLTMAGLEVFTERAGIARFGGANEFFRFAETESIPTTIETLSITNLNGLTTDKPVIGHNEPR